ncbi:lipocalin family protein [Fluviicola chungangensis]|uniref:Lipocalin-like domain-containing protein n=1 Tax=Fluviicola chungangensis TaxID=2597671 RepID=A0A556MGK2_9FLAO|nr:lipocalin family protein [Fluviicola chungangensis]TSJ39067.1 hypothetical protein FO442_18000 [Fluviicola chungangensis]
MKMYAKILSLFLVLLIGLSACSKEKRIEKQLIKKDGKWKITSVDYKYYQNNVMESSMNFPNAGTIEFDKKGSFVMVITLNGSPQTVGGTWTNSEDEITIIADGGTTVMKITDGPKKGKMTLEETDYYNDTAEKETYTYYLERAD